MEYFGIWNILKYGIFLKWNILKYGIFEKRQSITKQFVIRHKTFLPYFGIQHILEYGIFWNMEYSEIWNILENGIFMKIEYPKYRIFRKLKSKTKQCGIRHQPYIS